MRWCVLFVGFTVAALVGCTRARSFTILNNTGCVIRVSVFGNGDETHLAHGPWLDAEIAPGGRIRYKAEHRACGGMTFCWQDSEGWVQQSGTYLLLAPTDFVFRIEEADGSRLVLDGQGRDISTGARPCDGHITLSPPALGPPECPP